MEAIETATGIGTGVTTAVGITEVVVIETGEIEEIGETGGGTDVHRGERDTEDTRTF